MYWRQVGSITLVLALGCGDTPRATGDAGTCDPLAARPQPATLGTVVAAGSAPDGTLYVVTRDGSDTRVYVSSGDTLERRRVLGSGFGLGTSEFVDDTVSYEDTLPSRLVFQSDETYALRMALVHDDGRTFYDELTAKTELLVVPASALLGKPVQNLPGAVDLLFAATTADGQQLIVTRPHDDWTSADYRLYLGRDDTLQELPISSSAVNAFSRFDFVLHGMEGYALFGNSVLSPNTPSLLSHDDGEWALTLLPVGSGLPSGWRFSCL